MMAVSSSSIVRSSLEEMLDSLQRNEKKPTDLPPALPTRPASKARLPKRMVPAMFGESRKEDVKSNGGGFGMKKVLETTSCDESPYTMAGSVHEHRLAENGGAGLATPERQSANSGWDNSMEYYIKKVEFMILLVHNLQF